MYALKKIEEQEKKERCRDPGSNQGPSDLQSDALPTELSRRKTNRLYLNVYFIFLQISKKL